ncbi:mitochondrial dna helicase [Fusarium heterosporum]|uniref:ATP-dependent DNA helicase PIF1 n=1 Tax=Fusarium heterosporum TaxID=42747 RepID=A0A8H5WXE6_FUSHE|nr:mitochondrial dna helicase [Fusarium heterosporum]
MIPRLRKGHLGNIYSTRSLAQMGSLVVDARTTHRFYAPFKCLSTTSSLAKKSKKRVHESTPRSHHGLFVTVDNYDNRGSHLRPDGESLNEEQQAVFNLVVNQGESVFFTGPAGSGKSFLLKRIIKSLGFKYFAEKDSVGVTASTGIAAQNIGGTTLHRFAGVGLGQAPTLKLINDILDSDFKKQRWLDVRVLVVDEISMIDCLFFDKLDAIARAIRGTDLPFGGIQLVLCGDFFQLPPVTKGSDDGSPRFCFESKAWNRALQHTINLSHIYRQRDPEFTKMLNQIREGCLSPVTTEKFKRLQRSVAGDGVECTELFPLRREADRANARRLQSINGKAYNYTAGHGGTVKNPDIRKMLLSDCIAPEYLTLKEGAQVMLLKNIDSSLVNGSQGSVIGFSNKHSFLHEDWDNGGPYHNMVSSRELDEMIEDRLTFYPVVRFVMPDGIKRTHFCEPAEWGVERWVADPFAEDGWRVEKLATRTQVPLLLAWALSIHKAQGQTLDRVKVDLDRVFETGQAYVALSRSRSIDGLQVLNFDPDKVTVHPKAKAFYKSLEKKGKGANDLNLYRPGVGN